MFDRVHPEDRALRDCHQTSNRNEESMKLSIAFVTGWNSALARSRGRCVTGEKADGSLVFHRHNAAEEAQDLSVAAEGRIGRLALGRSSRTLTWDGATRGVLASRPTPR
jgi:hypothetical protein